MNNDYSDKVVGSFNIFRDIKVFFVRLTFQNRRVKKWLTCINVKKSWMERVYNTLTN